MPRAVLVLFVLALQAASVQAATPQAPPPIDCHDVTHRAVGFWVGDWKVSPTGSDTQIAASRIEWVLGGCAIQESFAQTIGPGGKPIDYHGHSYTAYNVNDGAWHQFYVDSAGHAASMHGSVENRSLVLVTEGKGRVNRMTVRAQADGSVRQSGEYSLDGGKTWRAGYDFTYRRITPAAA
jgi:hypothetical protein